MDIGRDDWKRNAVGSAFHASAPKGRTLTAVNMRLQLLPQIGQFRSTARGWYKDREAVVRTEGGKLTKHLVVDDKHQIYVYAIKIKTEFYKPSAYGI